MKISKNLKENLFIAKKKIFPINRSITGNGTLKMLKLIKKKFHLLKFLKLNLKPKYLIGKYLLSGTLMMLMY